MIYKKMFIALANMFGLRSELKRVYRPEGIKNWGLSDHADTVYQVYVTNYDVGIKNCSFGFWVNNEDEDTAYKMAFNKTVTFLIWSYKMKFKKWLK